MREIAEFRVDERFASMLFSGSEGKRLGDSVRKIQIETNDPRFTRIGELQNKLRQTRGEPFFYGWDLTRKYSASELASARLLSLRITSVFEPAGEECGTEYDESIACQRCGAGAKQIGPLFLDVRRVRKGTDFAKTIAGEVVVSQRVVELFSRDGINGVDLRPVRITRPTSAEHKDWYQMTVRSAEAVIVAPTRVGNNPYDDDPKDECRCPEGHLIGLNLLSEVYISSASRGEADIVASRQFIGVRRGLLRPERVTLISPRVSRLIETEKLKGCQVEVAHLV